MGPDARLRRNREKLACVLPGEVGDRRNLTPCPQDATGELWGIAHMNAAAEDASPGRQPINPAQRSGAEATGSCKFAIGNVKAASAMTCAAKPPSRV
jgi:hypothetical protein